MHFTGFMDNSFDFMKETEQNLGLDLGSDCIRSCSLYTMLLTLKTVNVFTQLIQQKR